MQTFGKFQADFATYKAGVEPPPFPVMIFAWTFLVSILWLYSVFVSLPVDALVASLHGYVNFVFFAAGGIGAVTMRGKYQARLERMPRARSRLRTIARSWCLSLPCAQCSFGQSWL